jgi:5-(carboxyamino)imidazole ribonucleotide synthase
MGYHVVALDPDPAAPIGPVVDEHIVAAYDDESALHALAERCAVVTTEFENPPAAALAYLDARTRVAPGPNAVATAQDRIAEKAFLVDIGVPVGCYAPILEAGSIDAAAALVGFPAVLKTARFGYDGKGQRRVATIEELRDGFAALGSVPCVLEALVALQTEVSVVAGRSRSGELRAYAVTENTHVNGILDVSSAPADIPDRLADAAVDLARQIGVRLDYCGVFAVELFVVDGELLVNELAPRPHNSGHWTIDASGTSQFEQQVRAICDLPLGEPSLQSPVAMLNVLGDAWQAGAPDWAAVLRLPGTSLHLYGKREPRPGRKMGHVTVIAPTPAEVRLVMSSVRDAVYRR